MAYCTDCGQADTAGRFCAGCGAPQGTLLGEPAPTLPPAVLAATMHALPLPQASAPAVTMTPAPENPQPEDINRPTSETAPTGAGGDWASPRTFVLWFMGRSAHVRLALVFSAVGVLLIAAYGLAPHASDRVGASSASSTGSSDADNEMYQAGFKEASNSTVDADAAGGPASLCNGLVEVSNTADPNWATSAGKDAYFAGCVDGYNNK
jgi:hypothetical protein